MSNVSRARGFWPVQELRRANVYQAGGTIYPGDAVKHTSAGQVTAASASDALLGVALGYATSGNDILVADSPDQQFGVNSSGAAPATQTDLMLNYDFVATGGSATYKMSRMTLDQSTGATTATLPLRLLAVEKRPNNALDGSANADCIVMINNHKLKGGTGTVGT